MMINKQIVAIPTTYAYVDFRSRLEARYAAFFDLVELCWEYEPINFYGWIPDFRLAISSPDGKRCGATGSKDCNHTHFLLVEVKPYRDIGEFKDTVEYRLAMQGPNFDDDRIPNYETVIALFGSNPGVSYWQDWHGLGDTSIGSLRNNWEASWKKAGDIVRWRLPERHLVASGR